MPDLSDQKQPETLKRILLWLFLLLLILAPPVIALPALASSVEAGHHAERDDYSHCHQLNETASSRLLASKPTTVSLLKA